MPPPQPPKKPTMPTRPTPMLPLMSRGMDADAACGDADAGGYASVERGGRAVCTPAPNFEPPLPGLQRTEAGGCSGRAPAAGGGMTAYCGPHPVRS
eukprot:scaffold71318_cov26-Phaeocystis_antarctica.AAC.1